MSLWARRLSRDWKLFVPFVLFVLDVALTTKGWGSGGFETKTETLVVWSEPPTEYSETETNLG